MAKLATDTLLKKSLEDILTELVNSTYDWQEYTDEEVGQLVELDPTQVAELSAVINDSVAATNKVYSSQHTKELLQENLIEANKYADDLVANLSNIKLDIVDSLPDSSTVNKSTIYILKDSTGGTNNTLNVWSDSTSAFVEVGKLSVSMDNYYTKSEVDTELTKKANADEVLKPDAIVADLSVTSGSTALSTAGLRTELDKKANKSYVDDNFATMDSRDIVLGTDVFIGGESKQVKNGNIASLQLQIWGYHPKTGRTVLVTNLYKPINKVKPTYFFDDKEASDVYNLQITTSGELVALNGFLENTCFINISYITSE